MTEGEMLKRDIDTRSKQVPRSEYTERAIVHVKPLVIEQDRPPRRKFLTDRICFRVPSNVACWFIFPCDALDSWY